MQERETDSESGASAGSVGLGTDVFDRISGAALEFPEFQEFPEQVELRAFLFPERTTRPRTGALLFGLETECFLVVNSTSSNSLRESDFPSL